MDDSPDNQPAVLHYATAPDPPGWPIGIYLAALAWAYVTLSLVTQSWVAPPWQARLERFHLRVQLVVLTCAAIRLYPPGWPAGLYVGALFWAFLTLRVVTFRLIKGPRDAELNAIALRSQLLWLAFPAARLAWALFRNDRSKSWVLYIVLLALAAPLWLLMEHIAGFFAG